jgi:hypothetical protein
LLAPAARAAATGQAIIARPHTSWSSFGVAERIRVPCPAARITTTGAATAKIVGDCAPTVDAGVLPTAPATTDVAASDQTASVLVPASCSLHASISRWYSYQRIHYLDFRVMRNATPRRGLRPVARRSEFA